MLLLLLSQFLCYHQASRGRHKSISNIVGRFVLVENVNWCNIHTWVYKTPTKTLSTLWRQHLLCSASQRKLCVSLVKVKFDIRSFRLAFWCATEIMKYVYGFLWPTIIVYKLHLTSLIVGEFDKYAYCIFGKLINSYEMWIFFCILSLVSFHAHLLIVLQVN